MLKSRKSVVPAVHYMMVFLLVFTPFSLALANTDEGGAETPPVIEESSEGEESTTEATEESSSDDRQEDSQAVEEEDSPINPPAQQSTTAYPVFDDVSRKLNEARQNITPDANTGALSYSYPFVVPPGRNGLTPELSLQYNSQNTDNDSMVGYGWSLSIPKIERVAKKGLDQLYTGPDYYFQSSVSGMLRAENASSTMFTNYGPEVENGSFIQYEYRSDDSWVATDKFGMQYIYGASAQARQKSTSGTAYAYTWWLEEVRDTNDNYVRYEYTSSTGQIYPSEIFYTGNGSTDGIFRVAFTLENRTDTSTLYHRGYSVTTDQRISNVTTYVSNTWVRSYDLLYTAGDNGYRSLLSSIEESGRSDGGIVIDREPVEFNYSQKESGWESVSTTSYYQSPYTFGNYATEDTYGVI